MLNHPDPRIGLNLVRNNLPRHLDTLKKAREGLWMGHPGQVGNFQYICTGLRNSFVLRGWVVDQLHPYNVFESWWAHHRGGGARPDAHLAQLYRAEWLDAMIKTLERWQ